MTTSVDAAPPRAGAAAAAFLTARWRHLVLLNYVVPPDLLRPFVPRGTMLDAFDGRTYVSLVGFRFEDTRLKGVAIPWHRAFEEVNLRFYVRREMSDGEVRRAVVFLRELVPRVAIAWVARWRYHEPYLAVPMSHRDELDDARGGRVEYAWRHADRRFAIAAQVAGPPSLATAGSEAEFITEHYWGYTRQRDGGTVEYRVEHPSWRLWRASAGAATFTGSAEALYGEAFGAVLREPPASAFVADGSDVIVRAPVRLA
ncbi:MAG: DUF2071 domain-containing protein [Vicinamibacterales bacterium]